MRRKGDPKPVRPRGYRPPTLALYLTGIACRWILGIFFVTALLIFLFDGLEMLRRMSDAAGFSILTLLAVTALRLPSLSEQVLPFAVLFGAIGALRGLTRRLELVVTRAAGLSVWQFMAPMAIFALCLGVFASLVYNPMATFAKAKSDRLSAHFFGSAQSLLNQSTSDVWFRQSTATMETIIHAKTAIENGLTLYGVTVFVFDARGQFERRVEARQARFQENLWRLADATLYTLDGPPVQEAEHVLVSELSAEQIQQLAARVDQLSFWDLPALIAIAEQTGQPENRFSLQFQALLAKPILLVAMVLIAATVSLRYSRSGDVSQLLLGGVLAGFILYVVTKVTEDFGAAGLVAPVVAAWSAPLFATLMGLTVLLYTEDG